MPRPILEQLADGVVLGDGGYVYILKERGVPMGEWSAHSIMTHPHEFVWLYQGFWAAGVDVLQAETFQTTRNRLARLGLADRFEAINRRAVELCRAIAGDEVLVAGSVGAAEGSRFLQATTREEVAQFYREQCHLLKRLGVDFLICETLYWLDDALLALEAAKETGLPVIVTMTFRSPTSYDGFRPADCAKRLIAEGADVVGINCHFDPNQMFPLIQQMRDAVDTFVAMQPVAVRNGLDGDIHWTQRQLSPNEMADYAVRAKEMGINYIGSCCGSSPDHVRAMAQALGKAPRA
ncbi:MAG: homocysteine S-methyltransferase family protein [Armatimonadetes bacterium]|nr:homocysteine S-methyltransferase family protein [Armatimonadota bacterium]MDW8121747.1 homocysteine S-methyltransferase family protein [Armatimonadota bacterium]